MCAERRGSDAAAGSVRPSRVPTKAEWLPATAVGAYLYTVVGTPQEYKQQIVENILVGCVLAKAGKALPTPRPKEWTFSVGWQHTRMCVATAIVYPCIACAETSKGNAHKVSLSTPSPSNTLVHNTFAKELRVRATKG